jgi:hypothetical protein
MGEKQKRIGIVTLPGYFNYGNRLQNYALQETLKELGFDVETLVVPKPPVARTNENKFFSKIKRASQLPPHEIYKRVMRKYDIYKRVMRKYTLYTNRENIRRRTDIFRDFSRNYLNERFVENPDETLESVGNHYDYLITGSDQVWNPHFTKGLEHLYFLTFTEPEKRIAYAASFGITDLPEYFKEMIKPWLSDMKAISVREDSGAQIVKDVAGRDAEVLLDPTLLLSKQKWLEIAKVPQKPNGDYILTYFLGKKPKEAVQLISRISREKKLPVINLADLKDKQAYQTGPAEFVDYINSASAVFTDSFHGVAFSVLLETPFVVYERIGSLSMYSRIETLLNSLNLGIREARKILEPKMVFDIDFSRTDKILQEEKNKAVDFLKNNLDT